jgi:hypothetical protein
MAADETLPIATASPDLPSQIYVITDNGKVEARSSATGKDVLYFCRDGEYRTDPVNGGWKPRWKALSADSVASVAAPVRPKAAVIDLFAGLSPA